MRWWVALLAVGALQASAAGVRTVARGDAIELSDHLAPGRLALVEFYADWCAPCRALAPQLERLAADHPADLVVLKVDIIDWKSPVARQFDIRSIPHLKLFSRDGQLLAEGGPQAVLGALERELGPDGPPAGRGRSDAAPVLPLAAGALLAVIGAVVAARLFRRPSAPPADQPIEREEMPSASADPAVWFVMTDGALVGPHSRLELERLVGRRVVDAGARVRRRGSADWTTVGDVLDR